MAGAGIILGGLIASVASKEEKEEVKKVSFAPTSDERQTEQTPKMKSRRSIVNLLEMAEQNPNSTIGKKIRSKVNLLDAEGLKDKLGMALKEKLHS